MSLPYLHPRTRQHTELLSYTNRALLCLSLGILQVSSEIEALKRRLRDRAAELDRLCGGEGEEDRGRLMRKLEDLGHANAREKKELEEKLSKVGF